jgi:phage host-nuclease inhibitor protein Gam
VAGSTPTPAASAIQSDEEAGCEAQEYLDLDAAIRQLAARERKAVARVRQRYADRRKPLEERRDTRLARVHAWAEATRNGRKTIRFPNGRIAKWRLPSQPKLIVSGKIETIVRLLLRLPNWRDYVSIELKKGKVKADLPQLRRIPGLRRALHLDKTEKFGIN